MFFESQHSLGKNEFRHHAGKDFAFPLHLHRAFEFYAQTEGTAEVTVGETVYLLSAGEAVLVFPFQVHAYRPIEGSRHEICIFSPDLAPDFYEKTAHARPTDPRFRYAIPRDVKTDNLFLKRSVVYGICGSFDRDRTYREIPDRSGEDLLVELLLFADKHYREACLLRDAAQKVGYDYAYASRLFKRRVGIPFRAYVNFLRVNESRRLLKEGAKSVSQIADACGFRSLRTFDREFRAAVGVPPSEYRKKSGVK